MDYLKRIKDREQQLSNLRARQDGDRDLLYLKRYEMLDAHKKAVPDIINITLNRPAVFAANVIAAVGKTSEQCIVEATSAAIDTTYIESFITSGFKAANKSLQKAGRYTLNAFFDEQACIRGALAARCAFQVMDGMVDASIVPWDTRFVTYEMWDDGLEYAAYSTTRSRSAILKKYPQCEGKLNIQSKGTIRDVWDRTHNEVWVEDSKIFEQEHSYGYVPVVIVPVAIGSMLADSDSESKQQESIFFLIRDVILELNRLASIMQTLNVRLAKAPLKAKRQNPGRQRAEEAPTYEDLAGIGSVTEMGIEEDLAPIDFGDARRAAEIAYRMFDKALQEGSLSSVDLGTLDFQLSAIALIELGEGRDQVFMPRLAAKAIMNQELATMFIDQVSREGGSVDVGPVGHEMTFNTAKLKGSYDITFKYFAKSPKIDMARASQAATMKSIGTPQRVIDEEILQVEDVDGRERQRRWEEAERLFPSIKIQRTLRSLLGETPKPGDDDAEFEAELASAEMGINLQAMMRGEISQMPKVEEAPRPMPLLLSQGGEIPSSHKRAADLSRTPKEPAEERRA